MIGKYLRLIIAGVILGAAIALIVVGYVSSGVWIIILSLLFVLFHFKNERILLAFFYVRKNKLQSAGKVLRKVKHPEYMIKSQEAYYYYLSALVEGQTGKQANAEKLFKRSLKTGLRMKNDQAVAHLNLSGIYLQRRNKKLAKYYMTECKKLDKQKILTDQIKEVEYMMKRI